ncbi:MAG: oligopeptide transporter, OPT family [Gammaproteobacteria bacterium]|nr:oligopeptide transporter, OPT family [Gammaproteobacteria bacterium]
MNVPLPPQLTLRAILLAIVLAMILAAANTYLGLFAGMTIASAIPAAVVSMAVLRLLGGGGILENNIVQTGASAGSSIASGVIFTIPALVILGFWQDFEYSWVVTIAGLGGILGVLFSVPLRRVLIVDQKLAFPEGQAAAEVLKAGENPSQGIRILGFSALGGAFAKLAAGSGLKLIPDTAAGAGFFGGYLGFVGTNLSPALLAVGYIVGVNVGVVALAGAMISWNIAIPIYVANMLPANAELAQIAAGLSAEDLAGLIWSKQIRYLGVGAMLVGGFWVLISLRKSLVSGISSGLAAARASAAGQVIAHTEQDLSMKSVLIGIVLFMVPLWALYEIIVGSLAVSMPMTVIMVVTGFLFCSVSAYMAGLVGSSNNPVSSITIATILFSSVMLLILMGPDSSLGPVAAIMVGAVVCCAACIAGDNLQDLKCGHIVGATPWRQQVMLAIGAASSALVMAPMLNLLEKAYGIGVPTETHSNPLLAPQATLMASVAKGLFGGQLPWDMITIGAAIGVTIIIIDEILRARGSSFRTPVLAVAVGIYLPIELMTPIFLGGMLAFLADRHLRRAGRTEADLGRCGRKGLLFAAGMITGEALMGIAIAIPIVTSGSADVLALPAGLHFGEWLGLGVLVLLGYLLYRTATRAEAAAHAG